ncbi:hypothetical protein PRIPAC_92122 [Pristionchus pacificus]|uniref:Uncharacterized protein n=1 Tax=Pristionchus pacificus TaxID=54126 RepID=A0A2A6BR20_PRIPA|nr:hypothetical protein PRIPAC_92122 [Pristionchus pacificus]|eukprot:PDM68201.1 hypothetical protein PRIPAC_46245 [Pristionchus pacificus]
MKKSFRSMFTHRDALSRTCRGADDHGLLHFAPTRPVQPCCNLAARPLLVAVGDHRDGHPYFPGGSCMLGDCEKEKREE